MGDAEESVVADLVRDFRSRIVDRTAGRICDLEVEVLADRVEIRGQATSRDLQDASLGILEAIRLLRAKAPWVEIGVRIRVVRARQGMPEQRDPSAPILM